MATAHTKVKRVEFIIEDEFTICNIFYESDEPGTPWGGGWKTKTFPKSVTSVDILNKDAKDYLLWSNGREGVKN